MSKRLWVLVVDDEIEIRRLLADIIESGGHRVCFAVDGEEAIEIVSRAETRFDLVFLDYMMPGQNGLRVLERLMAIDPDLRAVLVTGEKSICEHPPSSVRPLAWLAKPFSLDELESLIDAVASCDRLAEC